MDFRHLIVTCLFSKLRLPFDNQKVKENYAIFFNKRKNFFKSYLLPPHNQSATENIIHAILGTGYYTEKKQR